MTKLLQKIAIVLLLVMLAAAVSLGQKGREPEGQEKRDEKKSSGDERVEGKKTEGTKEHRIAKEGKLINGFEQKPLIVIDPGHGGYDPGKIGINQLLEKDVNLAIAKLLRYNLEAAGAEVILTREEDCSLCGEGEEQAKVRDLKRRIQIMEEAEPVAVVSIHQNSYPEEYVHGAQVFYYCTSKEGQALASALQERLREVDPSNERQIKDNDSYFLLKKTAVPVVIAECGFLSNWEEAEKLGSEAYQEELAWALYLGIVDFLEQKR